MARSALLVLPLVAGLLALALASPYAKPPSAGGRDVKLEHREAAGDDGTPAVRAPVPAGRAEKPTPRRSAEMKGEKPEPRRPAPDVKGEVPKHRGPPPITKDEKAKSQRITPKVKGGKPISRVATDALGNGKTKPRGPPDVQRGKPETRSVLQPTSRQDGSVLSRARGGHSEGILHSGERASPLTRATFNLPDGSHTLPSPGYPAHYGNNQAATWVLNPATPGHTVSISCAEFDVENDPHTPTECPYDYLSVNGQIFCGTDGPHVTASSLRVEFYSDGMVTAPGFKCQVKVAAGAGGGAGTPAPGGTAPSTAACCGKLGGTRIVGGTEVVPHRYPWQVGLIMGGVQSVVCGGSVLNTRYVLTAAHCTDGESASNIAVLVGMHSVTAGGRQIAVAAIIQHAGYDVSTTDLDVSLLRLAEPMTFDDKVLPVCMPLAGGAFDDVDAVVSGWGALASGGDAPDKLREVSVHTMTNLKCQDKYGDGNTITEFMLCAFNPKGDSCQGDSGGPLALPLSGRYTQIGVVSFGIGCNHPHYPGVYVRVTEVLPWINQHSADGEGC